MHVRPFYIWTMHMCEHAKYSPPMNTKKGVCGELTASSHLCY